MVQSRYLTHTRGAMARSTSRKASLKGSLIALANSAFDIKVHVHGLLGNVIAKLRQEGATDSEIRIAFSELMKSPLTMPTDNGEKTHA